jgi:hypothetical protein
VGCPGVARVAAVRILGLPRHLVTPSRIDEMMALEVCPDYRPGVAMGDPLPGACALTGWLYWIASPGGIVLEVDTWELGKWVADPHPRT